jgi:anti-sigma factor RsiW
VAHISEDDLEQYVMMTLPEAPLEQLEEHLLVCSECRKRLVETERYVAAMRAAAAMIRKSELGG